MIYTTHNEQLHAEERVATARSSEHRYSCMTMRRPSSGGLYTTSLHAQHFSMYSLLVELSAMELVCSNNYET